MYTLHKSAYEHAYQHYLCHAAFFPLVAAVLCDTQDGVVYVDNQRYPTAYYVEHAFGFAQIFGIESESFYQQLYEYLFIKKTFVPVKIRLYTPNEMPFLADTTFDGIRAFRQRFVFPTTLENHSAWYTHTHDSVVCVKGLLDTEIDEVDRVFRVVQRFWRTPADFMLHAHARVVWYEQSPVAICYAAAVANDQAEVDVVTHPNYRQRGFASMAVSDFITECRKVALHPVWDCFTNNLGSMNLSHKSGFVAERSIYAFYTIAR